MATHGPFAGASAAAVETLSMAALIERLGEGVARFDAAFTRHLAARLQEAAARIRLPAIDRAGLQDVVVTFSMARRVDLVATGRLPDGPGDVTIRWAEGDLPDVAVELAAVPRADPYTFATLDFAFNGRSATLARPVDSLAAGTALRVRALATIGARVEVRAVVWRDGAEPTQRSLPLEAIAFDDAAAAPTVAAGEQA